MKNRKIWKMAAAAGSLAVLASCQAVLKPYGNVKMYANVGAYAGAKGLADAGPHVGANGYAGVETHAGTGPGEAGYFVAGPEECRRFLMETFSAAAGRERQEVFVTGEDYVPETLILAQMFPEAVNISNTKIREYTENGKRYVTCRIGFEKTPEPERCAHRWETEILETGTCLWGQKEKWVCSLCGEEKILSLAPPGHVNEDGDSLCDRCGDRLSGSEEIETRFWAVGDVYCREIGGKTYQFRCIDDDYRSENSNHQKCALFLCSTVIRSDTDSTDSKRETVKFGETNNYKTSEVRKWLLKNSGRDESDLVPVNTGVNSAFLGHTGAGTYGQFAETELTKQELPPQVVMDRLFLLSMEEALMYRDELWDADGAGSPCSRGYWLRTPAFEEEDGWKFVYGNWEYAVDLENGLLGPKEVSDTSMGIRPALCLPQT